MQAEKCLARRGVNWVKSNNVFMSHTGPSTTLLMSSSTDAAKWPISNGQCLGSMRQEKWGVAPAGKAREFFLDFLSQLHRCFYNFIFTSYDTSAWNPVQLLNDKGGLGWMQTRTSFYFSRYLYENSEILFACAHQSNTPGIKPSNNGVEWSLQTTQPKARKDKSFHCFHRFFISGTVAWPHCKWQVLLDASVESFLGCYSEVAHARRLLLILFAVDFPEVM